MEGFKHLNKDNMGDVMNRLAEIETYLMALLSLLKCLNSAGIGGNSLCSVGKVIIEEHLKKLSDISDILLTGKAGKEE